MNLFRIVSKARIIGLLATAFASFLLAAGASAPAQAQNADNYRNEDDKRIKSAEVVGALGDGLFGEEINFYTGSTSFRHSDLSLPGNNVLPVEAARFLDVVNHKFDAFGQTLGDWELEVPYVGGLFLTAKGWVNSSTTPTLRCSSANASTPLEALKATPPAYNGFSPYDYWNGYDLFIPGQGKQALMLRVATSPAAPTSGGPYPWLTKDLWQISCLSSISNGSGEGFMALTPNGTKYTFNYMVAKPHLAVQRQEPTGSPPGSPQYYTIIENRQDIRLYASHVEDRFGNWVNYNWTGANLSSITASDGRTLSFTYASTPSNRITSVSDGTRTVSYGYDGNGSLSTVTYPDASQWTLQLANVYPEHFDGSFFGDDRWDLSSPECGYKQKLANTPATGSLTHPSGATGSFTFQFKRHVRASVPDSHCPGLSPLQPPPGVPNRTAFPLEPKEWDWVSWSPRTFDVMAIISKQITGPDLTAATWTYAYAGDGAVLDDDYGPKTRSVTVTEPDNRSRVFTFGNRFQIDEGQLLALDSYAGGSLLQHKQSTYIGNGEIAAQAFPDRIGHTPYASSDIFMSERLRPLKLDEILQDDVAFTRTVNSFDGRARPTSVTAESSLSYGNAPTRRTDVTTYEDNLATWVLGQVKTVTNTDTSPNKVIVNNTYHASTALLTTSQSFGIDQPTLAYNADGTVATVTDRRNYSTTLSNWYRGVPQTIAYPNSTSESAAVNNRGWVTSVTNALGTPTVYGYDTVGRLTLIDYTNTDTVLWNNTTRGFSKSATAAYGLSAGHWTQTVQTGNARTTTYYDALWRPRLILTEDTGNASSKSFVVKRYDAAGREAFTSYPVGTLTSVNDTLTGIRTFYDGLGRVIRVEQDAETALGSVLVTTTEYLPGFQTRVTPPRGFKTVTSYQVFDAPSTDAPVSIVAAQGQAEQQTTAISRNVFGKPLSVTRSGAGQ